MRFTKRTSPPSFWQNLYRWINAIRNRILASKYQYKLVPISGNAETVAKCRFVLNFKSMVLHIIVATKHITLADVAALFETSNVNKT